MLRAGLVALLGLAVATPAALAGKTVAATPSKGQMTVDDTAGVFHPDSVIKAEAKFNGVTFKSPTQLMVKTFQGVPKERKADFDKAKTDPTAKKRFMEDWARELAKAETVRGVFVLVCLEAQRVEVVSDRQADLYRHFDDSKCDTMAKRMVESFRGLDKKTDDEKKIARGEGLVNATDYFISQVKGTAAPESSGTTHTDGGTETKKAGMPWWGWVLIVAGVLLFIWVIIALIRAMSGNVYGPGYGGYGYGGGGGGGGFFPSLLGGMFGAMAGMWMYNSFFGGHMTHDPGAAAAGDYGNTGATDTGAGDYDNGAAGGADWGDDAGGGGGGGDWGGDAGGGDWGGDAGGGDWGGGGDFGGGGGDW
jgi:uncharacterized protein